MAQRSNDAAVRDALIMSNEEEYAEGMELIPFLYDESTAFATLHASGYDETTVTVPDQRHAAASATKIKAGILLG